ncbi:MAG: Hint domain-containing protein [Paracoccaceae bacterium]|nr:Hint domain-containing protein [Paracoccaceae bacterium]
MPGIFVDPDHGEVEYFHLLFDHHEVIFAEDAPTESFYTGPEALKAISAEAMEEILAILPELNRLSYAPDPACHIPTGDLQKKLVARHAKNNQPLI